MGADDQFLAMARAPNAASMSAFPCAKGWQWRRPEFLFGRATRLSVPSRWYSRNPLHLKAAHRVPGRSRLVRYRLRNRPEELCTFFHRESRFAASHAAAETAETPLGFPSSFFHRPIRYRDRKNLVAAAPPYSGGPILSGWLPAAALFGG